jgi:hypothetical protein
LLHPREAASADRRHWQYNTFVVHWKDRSLNADACVTFIQGASGAIEEVRIKPLTGFSFDFQELHLRPAPRQEVRCPNR